MFGSTVLMELKIGWKGFFIFTLLILLVAGGMPGIYPTFKESLTKEYEGSSRITIELPEDNSGSNINLSWVSVEGAIFYTVVESNRTHIIPPTRFFTTNDTNISIPYDFDETRYYLVLATVNLTSDPLFIGMTGTDINPENLFSEFFDNPFYAGFAGGRELDFFELKGFLTIELFGWWWMLVGFFIAYMAVAMVANDFTEKRMDLIFSTPLSRERYLIEKFMALGGFAFFITLVGAGALIAGVNAIGYGDELGASTAFLAFIGCIPFLLVIAAVGMLTAVIFKNTRVGMGLTFMFILFEFIFFTIAGFSKDLEWFKYISIMEYWDYRSVLLDGTFNVGYFIGLFVAAFIILGLAIYIFKKRDIPA